MKTILFTTLFMGFLSWVAPTSLAAQNAPSNDPLSTPTIERINAGDIAARRKKPVSTPSEHYFNGTDETPIQLTRDQNNNVKLHIKGRGDLNTVEIFDSKSVAGDYPVMSRTFRGVNYEEVNLSGLKDGSYRVRISSPHRHTDNFLELKSEGTN